MPEPVDKVEWGPCCFCGEPIPKNDIEPCRLTLEAATPSLWQVWFCHVGCFTSRVFRDDMGMLDPAKFWTRQPQSGGIR